MIDIHTHILPGIDDGAQTLQEAIELLHIAADDGITHIVATPHMHQGRFDNSAQSINQAYQRLLGWITDNNFPMQLATAAEVRISTDIITMLGNNTIPTIGHWQGNRVMLLEMPHSHILPGSDKLVHLLLKHNITPLIAHPERNKEIMRNPHKIEPFVNAGCLLQVTAGSVTGRFGTPAQQTAEYLLEQNWVTLLATDSHNQKHRPPRLAEGYQAVASLMGAQHAQQLAENVKTLTQQRQYNA